MWTAADRERYGRAGLRYPSDLTDGEWALIAPLIRPAKRGGRARTVNVRELWNAISPCSGPGVGGRRSRRTLPPRSTVWAYLDL